MKYRAKETAWFDMKYLTKGMEFDAPDDFDAPWAERLAEPKKEAPKQPAQAQKAEEVKPVKEELPQPTKAAKQAKPSIQRKPTAKEPELF